MSAAEDRFEKILSICVPVVVLSVGCGARLLPSTILYGLLTGLTLWTGLSIPLAILMGHCVLNED